MKKLLTKSLYVDALQCYKLAWLRYHNPEFFDSSLDRHASEGIKVGQFAANLFEDVAYVNKDTTENMVKQTKDFIKEKRKVIAEATFVEDDLMCKVDYLEFTPSGKVIINEVKSVTSITKKESQEVILRFLTDVAFQAYVLELAGFEIEGVNIIHLNNKYVRCGEIDAAELFVKHDLTREAILLSSMPEMKKEIKSIRENVFNDEDIGDCLMCSSCGPASSRCPAWEICSKHLPEGNVTEITKNIKPVIKWYNNGIVTIDELYRKYLEGTADITNKQQLVQVECAVLNKEIINKNKVIEFVDEVEYPLYSFDFETYQSAIPLHDDEKPYQQVPFQYSVHYQKSISSDIMHEEFLAKEGMDGKRECAESLIKDLGTEGSIIVYNASFERSRLKELAALYPDLSEKLYAIIDRLLDFEIPFRRREIYKPAFKGSSSIKYVLPGLFPDDETLNYKNLPGVQKGDQAMDMFLTLPSLDEIEREMQRDYMLRYCSLDTFAMFKVWEYLLKTAGRDKDAALVSMANERYHEEEAKRYAQKDKEFEEQFFIPEDPSWGQPKSECTPALSECFDNIIDFCGKPNGIRLKGFSEKKLADLYDGGYISSVADLLSLTTKFPNYEDIANADGEKLIERKEWGKKSVENLAKAIDDINEGDASLKEILVSLSIPGCGKKRAEIISNYIQTKEDNAGRNYVDNFLNRCKNETFTDISGIGEKICVKITSWYNVFKTDSSKDELLSKLTWKALDVINVI